SEKCIFLYDQENNCGTAWCLKFPHSPGFRGMGHSSLEASQKGASTPDFAGAPECIVLWHRWQVVRIGFTSWRTAPAARMRNSAAPTGSASRGRPTIPSLQALHNVTA